MQTNQSTLASDLIHGYQGYGLGIFTDERANSDEFIIYMEEVTIPGHQGAAFDPEAEHDHERYTIFLTEDDGTRKLLGHIRDSNNAQSLGIHETLNQILNLCHHGGPYAGNQTFAQIEVERHRGLV